MFIDPKKVKEIEWPHTVKLTEYNYDIHQSEDRGSVDIHLLRRSLGEGGMAELLDGFMNDYSNKWAQGMVIGRSIAEKSHLTIVSCAVQFCLGILMGIGKYADWRVDGRNERAVATCKKITDMVEKGELGADFK